MTVKKNPLLPNIEMTVELYKPAPGESGERLFYALFIGGKPVEFEKLRGAKRLLADALIGLTMNDYERKKTAIKPAVGATEAAPITDPIPGPPERP